MKHPQCLRHHFQRFLMTKEQFSIQPTFIFKLLLAYQYLTKPHWSLQRMNFRYDWFSEQLRHLVLSCSPLTDHVNFSSLNFLTFLVVTFQSHSVCRRIRSCFARSWAFSILSSLSFLLDKSLDQISVSYYCHYFSPLISFLLLVTRIQIVCYLLRAPHNTLHWNHQIVHYVVINYFLWALHQPLWIFVRKSLQLHLHVLK